MVMLELRENTKEVNGYYRSRSGAVGYTEQFQLCLAWGVFKDMPKSYLFGNDYSQRKSTREDCEG